jgi:hypothetical protein
LQVALSCFSDFSYQGEGRFKMDSAPCKVGYFEGG